MHKHPYRIYYEDTDAGGVVYYANYLKFAERARTEYLRDNNIIQTQLLKTDGIQFVVRHAELDLIKPARLDDLIEVTTKIEKISGARIIMHQQIMLDGKTLAKVNVHIACVDKKMKPARLPASVKDKINQS